MRLLLAFVVLAGLSQPARADVDVGFWSREMTIDFPHAFFTAKGTAGGKPVDVSYGFTAKAVGYSILFGPVPGRIDETDPAYIAKSHEHFRIRVSDATWARMLGVVQRWSSGPGSVYRLKTHNCVQFIGEAAQAAGMTVHYDSATSQRPTKFLAAVAAANIGFPTLTMVDR